MAEKPQDHESWPKFKKWLTEDFEEDKKANDVSPDERIDWNDEDDWIIEWRVWLAGWKEGYDRGVSDAY